MLGKVKQGNGSNVPVFCFDKMRNSMIIRNPFLMSQTDSLVKIKITTIFSMMGFLMVSKHKVLQTLFMVLTRQVSSK